MCVSLQKKRNEVFFTVQNVEHWDSIVDMDIDSYDQVVSKVEDVERVLSKIQILFAVHSMLFVGRDIQYMNVVYNYPDKLY